MEGGSPSKGQVDQMMEDFMESKIDDKLEAHFKKKMGELEGNLGKVLKLQTDRIDETQIKVQEMFAAAASKLEENEQRISELINGFNQTFAHHKGIMEAMYDKSEITAQEQNANLSKAQQQVTEIVGEVNKNKAESTTAE